MSKNGKVYLCFPLILFIGACSTVVEGTDQSVAVLSEPSGADCSLERQGTVIGTVNPTPGSVRIGKSRHPVSVTCTMDGYAEGVGTLESSFDPTTLRNALIGGPVGIGVGFGVDAATGAINYYPNSIEIDLVPVAPTDNDLPDASTPDEDLPETDPTVSAF